jgi:hypothetical protein
MTPHTSSKWGGTLGHCWAMTHTGSRYTQSLHRHQSFITRRCVAYKQHARLSVHLHMCQATTLYTLPYNPCTAV